MRSSAASTRRTTTSATSGSPTPGCSPPCTCSPPSASSRARCPTWPAEYQRYCASGEINSRVADVAAATARVETAFAGRPGVEIDHLDGLTVTHPGDGGDDPMWWFNLRPSNTEPLLRLNAEAAAPGTMSDLRDEVLALVRQS